MSSTSHLQTFRHQDIRADWSALDQSSRSGHKHKPRGVGLSGDGRRQKSKYAGTVSAACGRGKCSGCYKLDCPHDCHKGGK